jgi:hypothetical protein
MDQRTAAAIKGLAAKAKTQEAQLNQLLALQKASVDAPKWIEQIPGRRVPFWGIIDLTISADSTAKVDGTYSVTEDGPFVVTGVALFFKKTSGSYAGIYGYANAAGSRIASGSTGMQHGYQYLTDQPWVISGSLQIADRGSDRNWQNKEVSSALFSPEAGGVYVLPTACLFDRNSVIEVGFTPGVSIPYSGSVQCVLLGYKIVQGQNYQP